MLLFIISKIQFFESKSQQDKVENPANNENTQKVSEPKKEEQKG